MEADLTTACDMRLRRKAKRYRLGIVQDLITLAIWMASVGTSFCEVQEYCQLDSFAPKCADNQVVLMKSAEYGRMKLGKCLSNDYYVGCKSNVLPYMDSRCSGRQTCEVRIPDKALVDSRPCREDLLFYLEADYQCVAVAYPNVTCSHHALGGNTIKVANTPGYLVSGIGPFPGTSGVMDTDSQCTWRLLAPIGQTINVTLYDVAPGSSPDRHRCPVYATVKETLGDNVREHVICGGNTRLSRDTKRRQIVYASKSNRITIVMPQLIKSDNGDVKIPRFLLEYKAAGCQDPPRQEGMVMERSGGQLQISCNSTMQTWHLVCRENEWVGQISNCTHTSYTADSDAGEEPSGHYFNFSNGIVMAVIIGIILGVLIGFCLLIAVYHLRKRRHNAKQQDIMMTDGDMSAKKDDDSKGRFVDVTELHDTYEANDPMLPPTVTLDRDGRIIAATMRCPYKRAYDRDHVYEKPKPGSEGTMPPPPYPYVGQHECPKCNRSLHGGFYCNKCNVANIMAVPPSGGREAQNVEVPAIALGPNGMAS